MATISPDDVIAASAYVKPTLEISKRRGLVQLAQLWSQVDAKDIRGTAAPVLPRIAQLMHEQQAAGRKIAWSQGQLATAVATGKPPGSVTLPISEFRDGYLPSGTTFEAALTPSVPGTLARIAEHMLPELALEATGRVLASMVGTIAHAEARAVTQDLVFSRSSVAAPVTGYARRAEGANTCDFCRTLITRGPVYARDTAGFRAHRFCDCTVYATSMDTFIVDPNDWAAYQRWANSRSSQIIGTEWITTDRLSLVTSQIDSYEPIVKAGNGTEWMRAKLDELYAERTTLEPAPGSYRMAHQAPGFDSGGSLTDLRSIYPDDFYDHPEYYLDRGDNKYDQESLDAIRAARGKPDSFVSVYRASPVGTTIEPGDWVSLSPTYAKQHGMDAVDEALDMPVYRRQVRVSELFNEGNSINEFGWDPSVTPPGLLRVDPADVTIDNVWDHPLLSNEIHLTRPGQPFYSRKNQARELQVQLRTRHYYYDDANRIGVVTPRSLVVTKPGAVQEFNEAAGRAVALTRHNIDEIGDKDLITFDLSRPVSRMAAAQTFLGSRRIEVSRTVISYNDPKLAKAAFKRTHMPSSWTVSNLTGSTDLDSILVHEMGHVCDQADWRVDGVVSSWGQRKLDLYSWFVFQGIDRNDVEMVNALRRLQAHATIKEVDMPLLGRVFDGPTIYARSSPNEMFAEAFSVWTYRNERMFSNTKLKWAQLYAEKFGWK